VNNIYDISILILDLTEKDLINIILFSNYSVSFLISFIDFNDFISLSIFNLKIDIVYIIITIRF